MNSTSASSIYIHFNRENIQVYVHLCVVYASIYREKVHRKSTEKVPLVLRTGTASDEFKYANFCKKHVRSVLEETEVEYLSMTECWGRERGNYCRRHRDRRLDHGDEQAGCSSLQQQVVKSFPECYLDWNLWALSLRIFEVLEQASDTDKIYTFTIMYRRPEKRQTLPNKRKTKQTWTTQKISNKISK